MMQQSERQNTIGIAIAGSMCMCDATYIAGGGYYAKT